MMFSKTASTVEKRRKGHEQEEQAAPQTAHRHIGEDVGQGDEDEAGAAGLVHTVGEAGREDDEAGGDGHEGIQHHDTDALAQQGVLLADVAAEDGHCTDAEAQGEEGLIHGPHQRVDDAHLLHAAKVGHKEEVQALLCAGHEQAVDGQHHHDDQQGDHHALGYLLQAVLQTAGADQDAARPPQPPSRSPWCSGLASISVKTSGHLARRSGPSSFPAAVM